MTKDEIGEWMASRPHTAAVWAAMQEALMPFLGQTLSPENVDAMKVATYERLLAFEATQPELERLRPELVRGVIERSFGIFLEQVAKEMAEGATEPGGEA